MEKKIRKYFKLSLLQKLEIDIYRTDLMVIKISKCFHGYKLNFLKVIHVFILYFLKCKYFILLPLLEVNASIDQSNQLFMRRRNFTYLLCHSPKGNFIVKINWQTCDELSSYPLNCKQMLSS